MTHGQGLAGWRVDYSGTGIDPASVPEAPLELFNQWLGEANDAGLAEPNAMILATADANARPSVRHVLLKAADARGFSFFTNYASRKAGEILVNSAAALAFPWFALGRQVTVRGQAQRLPVAESEVYFASRPRDAQIGAWTSPQSQPVTREELVTRWASFEEHFAGSAVPMPPNWGGFIIVAESVEFWVGQPSRLHDRVEYVRSALGGLDDGAAWQRRRLAP